MNRGLSSVRLALAVSDFDGYSDQSLLELKLRVDREARVRGIMSSVGELGELAVISLFKKKPNLPVLSLAPPGTKNVDALSRDGERYSIKTLQHGRKTGTIYPDAQDSERQLFEHLVVAVLSDDMKLAQVVMFDWAAFCLARSWDSRMKAWYVQRSVRAFGLGREIDLD
jgi:hypothetical protein